MDIQFQELIEKIKKDGIECAEQEATRICTMAEARAKEIIVNAQKEAAKIIETAKQEVKCSEKTGMAALEKAGQNLVLALRSEIEALLRKIVLKETGKVYDSSLLKAVIPEIVKGWATDKGAVNVILDEKELSALSDWAKSALSEEISAGVELKTGKGIGAGFRIGEKNGSAYYDFSAVAVAEALSDYLNPALTKTLKNAVRGM